MSKRRKASRKEAGMRWLVWAARLVVGATFLFSGFVKGVDPWGTYYKFGEYLNALSWTVPDNLLVAGVGALCLMEFLLGAGLALGCFRRAVPLASVAVMAFMLVLTLWIAVFDPISDCGCFGDFLVLSNWATFAKNVVLTLLCVGLVKWNRKAPSLVCPPLQWLALGGTFAFLAAVGAKGWLEQPLLDFRPFPVGSRLMVDDDSEVPEYLFVYVRGKERLEVPADDRQPSEADGWRFLERREKETEAGRGVGSPQGLKAPGSGEAEFRIFDDFGDDVSDVVLDPDRNTLLVLYPDLDGASVGDIWKIQDWQSRYRRKGGEVAVVGAGSDDAFEKWTDLLGPELPPHRAEDTLIKMVARGNPAVVELRGGKIVAKSTLAAFDFDHSAGATPSQRRFLRTSWIALASWEALLVAASCIYRCCRRARGRKRHLELLRKRRARRTRRRPND